MPRIHIVSKNHDLRLLNGLESLSWLSTKQLRRLAAALFVSNIGRNHVIFNAIEEPGTHVLVLLSGVARLTCLNRRKERMLVALLAPGVIPDLPFLVPQIDARFQCDAFTDCRVGKIRSQDFTQIVFGVELAAFRKLSANTVAYWSQLVLRCSNLFRFRLHERLAIALLQLGSEFGVPDPRGLLLRISLTMDQLAQLVCASRQKTAEQMTQLEHEDLIVKQGRQVVLRPDRLEALVHQEMASNHPQ
jgi:CRP-like cAMP-binding protein